jgi:tetratricopeptide (TPR) repeat protein
MTRKRALGWVAAGLMLGATTASAGNASGAKKFTWTTESTVAKKGLTELQARIESFQFGTASIELAQRIVAADPDFAMGEYYLSAVSPPPDNQAHLDKAVALAKQASEGERRFIEAMVIARSPDFQKAIEPLEKLAADYPDERLVYVILGQIHQGAGDGAKARKAFLRAQEIGPPSARVRSFLANDDLLEGHYAKARATFEAIEKELPKGSAPFAIRYGVTFSHLYESNPEAALASLEAYLKEYRESGAAQAFPEVFIFNSIARINLENGHLEAAMEAYEKGYASVPESRLPEDQKQTWLGRLHHGKCRVLAKMGKHEEAWQEAETVRTMITEGGEAAQQFLPSYHYLAGYVKLEEGELEKAVEHLKQADPNDPFNQLLLARAYERLKQPEKAKEAYREILASQNNGLERALAYPEAKRRLSAL